MVRKTLHLTDEFSFLGENGADPILDIYLPFNMDEMNRQNQKRKCVVICPGGGYGMVSQRESEAVAVHFLTLGFNAFVLKYSVAPHKYPTQLIEVAAAYELIYKNQDSWNCDTDRIAIMGFSAGGHLAAHYSNAYKSDAVRKVFPESRRPFASILCYPVISPEVSFAHQGSFMNLCEEYPRSEEQISIFACDRLVSEDTPPAFIWSTGEDNVVPIKNSIIYAETLYKYGIPAELHIYPYGWHGLSTADDQTNGELEPKVAHVHSWLDSLKKWIKITF